ncbi:hypothetical protein [Runella slithyformis]|uniref:Aerotolerance regulator N-terminal domain-containing protein n=1 Tax=Runella slithyformis (strain ATCC 29530 / DSM 19594 / LMG 11500 / NCIMB 11436 / LSU 4) TaxID=761193 RepID=A0A7U3ZPI2_RUNSL|nr:hypothetical protein [Runella slithyformis]AEI50991.1 hypothetical protein Runsl_4672 [Runella slithyformis DSM 19594]
MMSSSAFFALLWIVPFSDGLSYVALTALLLFLMRMLLRAQSVEKKRFRVRLGLTLMLWTALVLYVIQPQWSRSFNPGRVLLYSSTLPAEIIQKNRDSLNITESFSFDDWERRSEEDPGLAARIGTVYLAGQDVGPQALRLLSGHIIHWIPAFPKDELQAVQWKGMLRKGELQEITGKIEVDGQKMLRLRYARQVLDSVLLPGGVSSFRLRFPAFGIGRAETTLELDHKPLKKVAFYTRKPQPLSVYFMLQSPDFESKTLAEWLGKNGSRVEMITTVAKNTQRTISINRWVNPKPFVADLIITDPENAGHPMVKKAVADGKSVLFFNIIQPEPAIKKINAALGTQWRIRKTSNEESVGIGKGMTSLPYQLEENLRQRSVFGYPAAVQKVGGKVGLSLVNETFPLKLSGDSLTYNAFWSSILQVLSPTQESAVSAVAPLWKDVRSSIVLNHFSTPIPSFSLAHDTVLTQGSPLNALTGTAEYIFRTSGWLPFQDSLEVYVEPEESAVSKAERLRETLRAHHQIAQGNLPTASPQVISSKLPDWAWMLLFLLCLTALWIEPKLRY